MKTLRFLPAPEVQKLPTLFLLIEQGEIRVPAFQRGFVWGNPQIIELLKSIYHGIPIGSFLFWKVEEESVRVDRAPMSPFPVVPDKRPFRLILDGLQRLYALYGVFHWPEPTSPNQYNVVFDLQTEEFAHYRTELSLENRISLPSLFSPEKFLSAQRALSVQRDSELLIERAIRLHSIFQDYPILTITIEDRSFSEALAIFETLNTAGQKLSPEELKRVADLSSKSRGIGDTN